ncbi:MAG: DUF3047 domain-containing protein [Planctomycetota bacterium]
MRTSLLGLLLLALLIPTCKEDPDPQGANPAVEQDGWSLSFAEEPEVKAGEVPAWCAKKGYTCVLGNPLYSFLAEGKLHLVAKPGPVHERRIRLALTDREKLRSGLESKVLIQFTPSDFALDPVKFPRVRIRMAPVTLPGKGADLRDSNKNDACFYLLLGFGDPIHEFGGVKLPDTLAYVWADQKWEGEVASDPDYREFLRYVMVGSGDADPGKIREITRNVAEDFRKAFPECFAAARDAREGEGANGASGVEKRTGEPKVPPLRSVSVMVDANTVESKSESVLESIQFLPPEKQ